MAIGARAIHGVNVCLIPSSYNDHKPLALRKRSLAFVSASLIAIKSLAVLAVVLTPTPAELSTITVNRIVQFTNTERENAGLSTLVVSSQLTSAAQAKAKHMLEEDYFAHISPTGVTPWFWISQAGYSYIVAGENLAIDFTEAEDVVAAWMASPSHKANILHSDFAETGVAVATGEYQGGTSTVVVHMFGRPTTVATTTPTPIPEPSSTPTTAGTANASPTPSPTVEPSLSPSPVPTVIPAPRIPRITNAGNPTVGSSIDIVIEGDVGSTAHILINSQLRASAVLPESGTVTQTISLADFSDGNLVVRAYAGGEGNQSDLSEPIAIIKDTSGPDFSLTDITFFISPAFDTSQATAHLPSADALSIQPIDAGGVHSFKTVDEIGNETVLENVSVAPQFENVSELSELQTPQRVIRLSRQISAITLAVLLILLIMAVFIRIRVQHPSLITHATLAIFIATTLFFL